MKKRWIALITVPVFLLQGVLALATVLVSLLCTYFSFIEIFPG